MPKEKATSEWWDDNLSSDILGSSSGSGNKSAAGSEWGDEGGSNRKSKQASAWDDAPKKKKQSAWDDAPKEKQQSAWDDAPKEKAGSAWYDSGAAGLEQQSQAAAKARQQSEWDAPSASNSGDSKAPKQKPQSEWGEEPKKAKGASGWGKSFRMSFGLSQAEPNAEPPPKSAKPVAAAIARGKLRPPTAAENKQDARFSFGFAGLGDSLGFGTSTSASSSSSSSSSGTSNASRAKEDKKSSKRTPEAEPSFFSSFLDPFGFFAPSASSATSGPGDGQAGDVQAGGSSRPNVKDKRSSW
jgi:hypothetical protein